MKRLFVLVLFCVVHARVPAAELAYDVTAVASPAGAGALAPTLARGPDGLVWLTWVEPADHEQALRVSTWDAAEKKWRAPGTIRRGNDVGPKASDFPVFAAGARGHATAVWIDGNGGALFSATADRGATWSPPAPLTRESAAVEKISVTCLADGRAIAAWLDGRALEKEKKTRLYARILGTAEPDTLIDASVCDCCQTALTGFPDGSVLLAYRGRTEDEIRDIQVARYLDGRWEENRATMHDGWKIAACPINGPRITSDGPRVASAWFTAVDGPRVFVSTSPDAGRLYTAAARVDLGHPVGRVDTVLLRDGTQLVSWLEDAGADPEQPAGFYLRRFGPGGNAQPPVLLSALKDVRGAGFPHLALAKDFDDAPAQLLAAFTQAGTPSRVETVLVTLPSAAALAEFDNACGCAARSDELHGYAIRGDILATAPDRGTLRAHYTAVPGVLRAGEREFKVAPAVLAAVKPGRSVIARIEERDGEWWIFDVRLLLPAATPR